MKHAENSIIEQCDALIHRTRTLFAARLLREWLYFFCKPASGNRSSAGANRRCEMARNIVVAS